MIREVGARHGHNAMVTAPDALTALLIEALATG
ncbi:hypothetical protein CLV67_13738 [Actinoplanes italicus]|uniref:Uncharacterized protein n=1 Tax=Actinoplanes italicus TaxID=113567 RepID=A0A2T0JNG8_9ACTN|nr:hypothetical protein CLV67_13738 [Actinoplanes italicus]